MSGSAVSLAGRLLVSHPSLRDGNFRETVVLLHSHSSSQGAMGVIINRPLPAVLAEASPPLQGTPLARLPMFQGGPVAADRFVLALDDLDPQAALQAVPALNLARQMDLIEKTLIEQALRRCGGKVPAAMELLGTPRKTLYDKLNRHGIQLDSFR